MSLLKFDDESPKTAGSNKSLKYLLGIGGLVGAIVLSSTFAASINLNAGGPVEFGQGVVQTTACDDEITVTPISTFVNAVGYGSHMFTSLRISGIDSSEGKCSGKRFLIKAYGDNGILDIFNYYEEIENPDSEPTVIQEDYDSIEIANNGGEFTWVSGGTDNDDVIPGPDGYITDTSFTIDFTSLAPPIFRTPLAAAEDVKRITVETYDANLLSDRVLSASQVGIVDLPGSGFDLAEPCVTENDCYPYFTFQDYLDDLTEEDVANFNEELGLSGMTLSQIVNAFSFKFTYDPSAGDGYESSPGEIPFWNLEVNFLGTSFWPLFESLTGAPTGTFNTLAGYLVAFDGNVGAFIPTDTGGEVAVVFSLNEALQNNPGFDSLHLWPETQPDRSFPIRNLFSIWTPSEMLYTE
jgi:hypothetical protein